MPSSVTGLHCVSRMPQALGFSISLVVAPQYLFPILSPLDLCSVHTDSDDLIWLYMYWWLHAHLSHPPSHRDLYLCAQLSAHTSTWMWEQMLSKPTHFTLTYAFYCKLLHSTQGLLWSQEYACPKCQRIHALETASQQRWMGVSEQAPSPPC